jgi:competence protein ComEA
MRKSHPIFVLALVTLFLALPAMAADAEAGSATAQTPGVVNINTADATQLALLPRVGEKSAQRIIDYRKEHGPFRKTSDLMQVKGIGEKTYEGLAAYVVVEGRTTLVTNISSPRKARAKSSAKPASQPTNQASS